MDILGPRATPKNLGSQSAAQMPLSPGEQNGYVFWRAAFSGWFEWKTNTEFCFGSIYSDTKPSGTVGLNGCFFEDTLSIPFRI